MLRQLCERGVKVSMGVCSSTHLGRARSREEGGTRSRELWGLAQAPATLGACCGLPPGGELLYVSPPGTRPAAWLEQPSPRCVPEGVARVQDVFCT